MREIHTIAGVSIRPAPAAARRLWISYLPMLELELFARARSAHTIPVFVLNSCYHGVSEVRISRGKSDGDGNSVMPPSYPQMLSQK